VTLTPPPLLLAAESPALQRCLNDLPWEGWPYSELAPPQTDAYEDVVSAALRLAVNAATMANGAKAQANLTKFSRQVPGCWPLHGSGRGGGGGRARAQRVAEWQAPPPKKKAGWSLCATRCWLQAAGRQAARLPGGWQPAARSRLKGQGLADAGAEGAALSARRFYDQVGPAFPLVVRHVVKEQEGRSLGNIMVRPPPWPHSFPWPPWPPGPFRRLCRPPCPRSEPPQLRPAAAPSPLLPPQRASPDPRRSSRSTCPWSTACCCATSSSATSLASAARPAASTGGVLGAELRLSPRALPLPRYPRTLPPWRCCVPHRHKATVPPSCCTGRRRSQQQQQQQQQQQHPCGQCC
jgi:hypothetical protein